MNSLEMILIILAVWRLTHLLSEEDGPFDIIFKIRKKAGTGFFGSLLDCFYCVSIWIAFPFGMWIGENWWEKIIMWLAFSGAACLLEQATTKTSRNTNKPDYYED